MRTFKPCRDTDIFWLVYLYQQGAIYRCCGGNKLLFRSPALYKFLWLRFPAASNLPVASGLVNSLASGNLGQDSDCWQQECQAIHPKNQMLHRRISESSWQFDGLLRIYRASLFGCKLEGSCVIIGCQIGQHGFFFGWLQTGDVSCYF